MSSYSVECVVQNHDQLGETPLWCDRTQKLWWLDIEKPKLQSFDPTTGAHTALPQPGTFLGSLALTKTDDLLVAIDLELQHLDVATNTLTPLAEIESGLDNRLNDGRVDRNGRLWIGTMDNEYNRPNGALYCVAPDGTFRKAMGDVKVSNGMAFSPDDKTFYFTDTRRHLTWAFDYDIDDGALTNQRLFADYTETGERPDGACVDVDGCLWNAFFAGACLVRYRPDGTIDRKIPMPVTNPTCICFGGNDLKTLYVTTAAKFLSEDQLKAEPLAGSLFAIEGLGQGLPEHRFGSELKPL